jgi:ribosomal-protein-serine acetyltransferase
MFACPLLSTSELRPLEPWRAEEFASHMDRARDHIRPWVGPKFPTEGVAAAREKLAHYAEQTARDGARLFGIWDEGILVGGVLFVDFDAENETCEIGCWLEPGAEGKGLVTAACTALLQWAFEVRGIHRAEWRCRADNAPSAAVAKRLGMTLEGVLRGSWKAGNDYFDEQLWSRLSSD